MRFRLSTLLFFLSLVAILIASYRTYWRLREGEAYCRYLAFSQDGKLLVGQFDNGRHVIWDLSHEWPTETESNLTSEDATAYGSPTHLHFIDNTRFYSYSGSDLVLWNAATDRRVRKIELDFLPVDICFTDDQIVMPKQNGSLEFRNLNPAVLVEPGGDELVGHDARRVCQGPGELGMAARRGGNVRLKLKLEGPVAQRPLGRCTHPV